MKDHVVNVQAHKTIPHVTHFRARVKIDMSRDKENYNPEEVAGPEKKLSGGIDGQPTWSEYLKMMAAEEPTVEEAPVRF
jgi:hypothetical protein